MVGEEEDGKQVLGGDVLRQPGLEVQLGAETQQLEVEVEHMQDIEPQLEVMEGGLAVKNFLESVLW